MKALSYLLGARAIDTAMSSDRQRLPTEPPFLPIASTSDTASAWRRWAAEGRRDTAAPADARGTAIHPAPAKRRAVSRRTFGDAA
ncbi:MAG TPA: hypothetical protein VH440_01350 [Candidatus Limnocylindrales bacterium]|jgi:hypothetical protein